MSKYVGSQSGYELYHWGIRLGSQYKDHKYIQRINLGSQSKPKYRYFYSQKEYDEYIKGQSSNGNTRSTSKKVFSKNDFSKLFNTSKIQEIKSKTTSAAKFVGKIFAGAKKTINDNKDVLSKIKLSDIKKSYEEKGKSFINKIAKAEKKVKKNIEDKKSKYNAVKNRVAGFLSDIKKKAGKEIDKRIKSQIKTKSNMYSLIGKSNSNKLDNTSRLKFIGDTVKGKIKEKLSDFYRKIIEANENLRKLYKPITEKLSDKENRDAVNEHYSDSDAYHSNCYSCSITYDLRKKGLDVKAIPDIYGGMYDEEIESFYKDGKFSPADFDEVYDLVDDDYIPFENDEKDLEHAKKLVESLEKQLLDASDGEDSSGFITISWYPYGGHIFNYEIKDGKITFVDTQPDESFSENPDHIADMVEYMSRSKAMTYNKMERPESISPINFMRTDNLEVNESKLAYVSVPSQIANTNSVDLDMLEEISWVYLNMYNNYSKELEKGIITRDQQLYPIGGFTTSITYNELEDFLPDLFDTCEEVIREHRDEGYNMDNYLLWVNDLEYVKKYMSR